MSSSPFSWKNKAGIDIYAREWMPDGEPRAVVALVHGLGEHIGRYEHVAAALNRAGYAMVGCDLPGHGQSGGTRGHASFDLLLDDLDTLLEQAAKRAPGKPVFIYGHSMGGALTLYYLLKCKPALRGAVVTSPGLGVAVPVAPAKLMMAKVMARVFPAFTMANGLDVNNLSRDAAVVKAYQDDPLVHPRISARLGLDLLTCGAWMTAHAGEISVPLLLVQGSKDSTVSPEATDAFAKAVRPELLTYKVWEGYFHETHNEPEKAQVLGYMIDWLDGKV